MAAPVAMLPPPPVESDPNGRGVLPFRQATTERTTQLPSETAVALTAGTQLFDRNIDGSGYMYGIDVRVSATAAANAAAVAFQEDGPWSALDAIVLHDVNGDIVNLTGYALYLANIFNHDYAFRDYAQSGNALLANAVSGGAANGGSFAFYVRIPVSTNRRDLLGLLGNQDRSQSYQLRTSLAASTAIYATAPTSLPAVTIEKYYLSYAVPLPSAPNGQPQMQVPPSYGSVQFTTRSLSETPPLGGAVGNHYVRRVGNVIRWIALVARANGSRLTAQANLPTSLQLKVGDETVYVETATLRQAHNWEHHGQVMPNGVLLFDNIHDFWPGAGSELGNDWWHTQIVQNMQFQCSWPAGMGSTNNSLELLTADLLLRQPLPAGR